MDSLESPAIAVIVASSILLLLSTVSVALRFVSIRRLKRDIHIHDWLIVISLVFTYAYAVTDMIGAGVGGLGKHAFEVSPSQLASALKVYFAGPAFWTVSTLCFRYAIILLYIELFGRKTVFLYSAYIMLVIVGLNFVGTWAGMLRVCTPIQYNWDKSIDGTCGDDYALVLWTAIINAAIDVLIVLLPVPVVWRLHMAAQKKAAITATFALGLSMTGFNIGRLGELVICPVADITYCAPIGFILMVCEQTVGIMVACVPTLGPVFFPNRYQGKKLRQKYPHQTKESFSTRANSDKTTGSVTIIGNGSVEHLEPSKSTRETSYPPNTMERV